MSKRSKRKNKAQAKAHQANAHSEKAYVGGGSYGMFYGAGQSSPDMRADEHGAAIAYTFNVAVSAAIEFWENWLDGIKWTIKAESDDSVLVSSDMRRFPKEGYGSKFAHAVKFHEQAFKHSWFKSVAFSDMMYGESYTRFICNDWHMPHLIEWLNPLAVEPDVLMGYIREYRYAAAEGYERLAPKEVAFRIAKRNSQNDLRGQSRVLAAIDALTLEANQKRSLKSYFKNGMNIGGLISPTSTEANLSPAQVMQLEDQLERKHKGSGNAGKMAIAPANMQIEMFPAVDIEKNYNIIKPLRDEILMAMGVYPQLAGDPSDANYDSAYDIKRQWWETRGIPYAKEIQGYINDLILPQLEPYTPVYFDFDFTPYEVEKPEVVSADFQAGFVDMYQAAELRGYEGDAELKGIYMINGVPMSKDIIRKLANNIPSQYALDYANAQAAGQAPNLNADMASGVIAAPPVEVSRPLGDAPENDLIDEPAPAEIMRSYLTETPPHDHNHDLLPAIVSHDADELEELAAWRKFVTNGKSSKRPFEQKALRGDIGDLIQSAIESHDKQAILSAFHQAQERIEARVKAIQATRLDFENDFDELLKRARAEKMGRVQWASAMRSIIRRYGQRAYVDGLRDGGVEDDPSEDDLVKINELASDNSKYVSELGNVLYKEDGISDAVADIKATLWSNKTLIPFYQAGLESSAINSMFEWVEGDTVKKCSTCVRLNGQRHRLKGWKAHYLPQGSNLECEGWQCSCRLVKVKGRERGNY